MDSDRRTGRTTRMLLRAILTALDEPNKNVWVMAHNINYAQDLMKQTWHMLPGGVIDNVSRDKIKLCNDSTITFAPYSVIAEGKIRGVARPSVFVDHYVYEEGVESWSLNQAVTPTNAANVATGPLCLPIIMVVWVLVIGGLTK